MRCGVFSWQRMLLNGTWCFLIGPENSEPVTVTGKLSRADWRLNGCKFTTRRMLMYR